jgi:UDP-N-acetylglucosamine 2-epimerase (non-hydrolysing)
MQENVDNQRRFNDILRGLKKSKSEFDVPVVYPVHPRSRKQMKQLVCNKIQSD